MFLFFKRKEKEDFNGLFEEEQEKNVFAETENNKDEKESDELEEKTAAVAEKATETEKKEREEHETELPQESPSVVKQEIIETVKQQEQLKQQEPLPLQTQTEEKIKEETEKEEEDEREVFVTRGNVELVPDASVLLSIEREVYSLFRKKVVERIEAGALKIVEKYQNAEKKHFVEALIETGQLKESEVFNILKETVLELGVDGVFFFTDYVYIDVIKTDKEPRFKYRSVEVVPKFFLSVKPSDIADGKRVAVLPLSKYRQLMAAARTAKGVQFEFEDVLTDAISKGASDIHIVPKEDGFYTFFRIKKQLVKQQQFYLDKTSWREFIQKLNNKASEFARGSFNVDDRKTTQEARIEYPDMGVSVRYEYVPRGYDDYGEIVCRILKKESISGKDPLEVRLKKLGYNDDRLISILKNIIHLEGGLIVISGKTNSGKSTFLAQLLVSIPESRKIGTIEDPIEYTYHNKNIVQHQLYLPEGGKKMDFLDYVKAFKRADYDVVLVGEWRRSQGLTEAMIEQAQAGQLIFTTLHISSAYDIYASLYNIFGVPFNISAEVIFFSFNQTLAPKLCPHCSEKVVVEFTESEVALLKNLPDEDKKRLLRYKAEGRRRNPEKARKCEFCGGTGYAGFVPIFEYFIPDEDIKKLIVERKTSLSAVALRDYIRREKQDYVEGGFATFKIDQALQLLENGVIEKEIVFKI